ncbi:leucine-rich repeat-containing [Lecanosticta acicola]|uniref:Leucine-rich repeat-containing n=1 Tax=Lecanosticta acicola TaxID=111012 RepID=A0AAI8Z372_9PEZI|nr:leucine-rich repeat-containing [Lecanosticta acicola]
MDSEDGQLFVKACTYLPAHPSRRSAPLSIASVDRQCPKLSQQVLIASFSQTLASFVRTHEKALANALQLQRQKTKNGKEQAGATSTSTSAPSSTTISLAEALTRPSLFFSSQSIRPAKLTLTPHHLYFLLSKFEDLGVDVGSMTVRLENLHSDAPYTYSSFTGQAPKSRGKQSDADSLRSVSSVRSVMSSMSSMWSSLTLSNSAAKAEKQMAQHRDDLKYLYSCFTKIPALRLSPDHRAKLISGFEEFPFDTAVPLFVFKNVSSLEICDLDFRQFHGWDRLSEQLRSLTVKRATLDDPIDLLYNIVLDDAEKRRKRSSKTQVPTTPSTPGAFWSISNTPPKSHFARLPASSPATPDLGGRRSSLSSSYMLARGVSSDGAPASGPIKGSHSPPRPSTSARPGSLQKPPSRSGTPKNRRSSGSSGSSHHEMSPRHSTSDLLAMGILPPSKWRFLRHLSVAESGLTELHASSLAPVSGTLQSFDLSGNLFNEIPSEALAALTHLRALNLSNCMITSLASLSKAPLPAITTLNLRSNRLLNLAGIERLFSLERIDVRDNKLHDPTELARLTAIPDIRDLYVMKNPFTRTHSKYRVTIFNLFRLAPGYTKDVSIDTMGPLYHEKKHLVDRAPEPANKPVIRPPPEDEELPILDLEIFQASAGVASASGPGHRRTTSDMGPQSTVRRKKATRRRIVELSQSEQRAARPNEDLAAETAVPELTELPPMPPTPATESDQPPTPEPTPYQLTPSTQLAPTAAPVRPKLDTSFTSPSPRQPKIRDASDDDNSPVHWPEDLGSNTDVYRQKVEALKKDLGPNWLSALNEERFVDTRARNRSFSPASRTSTIRADRPSRGVSVGGRTLG